MKVIQLPFAYIANVFWKMVSRISQSTRSIISIALSVMLMLLFTNSYCPNEYRLEILEGSSNDILCYLLLFLIVVFSMHKEAEPVAINYYLFVPGVLFIIWMLISFFMHSIGAGFTPFIIALITLIPIGVLALNDRESRKTFVSSISFGLVISCMETICISLLINTTFFSEEGALIRYRGITRNTNLMAMILLGGVIGLLCLAIMKSLPRILLLILCIPIIPLMLCTQSRTAIICSVLSLAIFLIWSFKSNDDHRLPADTANKKPKKFLLPLLIALVVLLIFAAVMLRPAMNGSVTLEDPTEEFFDDLSSKRLYLWSYVFSQLNLFGHDIQYFSELLPEEYKFTGAHNTALDFGYRCGIPCGILFLIYELAAVASAFIQTKRPLADITYQGFVLMVILSFFVESMLEVQVLPTNRNVTMLFFMVTMLIMAKPDSGAHSHT